MTSVARYYQTIRTAHLERLADMVPGWLLYEGEQYDFDPTVAHDADLLRRLDYRRVLAFVAREPIRVLEVNEPLALVMWPKLLLLALVLRLRRLLGRGRVELVAYCIENVDPVAKLATRLPRPLARAVIRVGLTVVAACFTRLAFGTPGAVETYSRALGRSWPRVARRTQLIDALPAPSPQVVPTDRALVGFVGAFDGRKGLDQLIDAWPLVRADRHDARLLLMGKGPQADLVEAWAGGRTEVTLLLDPPRAQIHRGLDRIAVLVLLSQPTPRWREQIGLPIVEGLAHGCEIVASDQTGLAAWLRTAGHAVLPADCPPRELADAVLAGLAVNRSKDEVRRALPTEDGRIRADRWLMETAS